MGIDVDNFFGTYTPRLDDKARLFLPAKFRPRLEGGVVLTRGQENCIYGWTTEAFGAFTDRIRETPNVDVLVNATVVSAQGGGRLESVIVRDGMSGEQRELPAAAMFIFIGTAPRTAFCGELVQRDAQGFVLTGRDLMTDGQRPAGWTAQRDPYLFETSVPGVFCAGDARHGSGKRVAAAVGEGSATVSMVHQYLQTV